MKTIGDVPIQDRIEWLRREYLRLHNRDATHIFLTQEKISHFIRFLPQAFTKGEEGFNKIMGMWVVPTVTTIAVGIIVE